MKPLLGAMFAVSALIGPNPARADASDVEHAKYAVVLSAGDIEIRDYAPHIVAETTVAGERAAAIREGFRAIADYIFGNNVPAKKIAMTAPVTQQAGEKVAMTAPVEQQSDAGSWRVRFVMPASYTMETLPRPKNPAVKLAAVGAKRMAAIRFSGLAGDEDLQSHKARLDAYIAEKKLKPRGAPTYAFYDPPWTLPWNRRNEILIEVAGK